MTVKVRIEARYGHNELPGKCEYFNGNSVNASCFNANCGSAHVTHTLVFYLRLPLSESIPMSVFALSSDALGRGLLDFWNGGADVLTWPWGRPKLFRV